LGATRRSLIAALTGAQGTVQLFIPRFETVSWRLIERSRDDGVIIDLSVGGGHLGRHRWYHIGGFTPSEPTMIAFAVNLAPSFVALTTTAPFVTPDPLPGSNVTIGAVGGTKIVCSPPL
jgi:hypothetical protein